MTGAHHKQIITGASVVLIATVGVLWLIPSQTVTTATGENDLSPSLVPHISMGMCLLLGLLYTVQSWRDGRRAGAEATPELEDSGDVDEAPRSVVGLILDLAVWIASSTATMLIIPHVGFIVTGTILLAGWLVFAGVRSVWIVAAVSLGLPVLLDRLCWYALTVQLP